MQIIIFFLLIIKLFIVLSYIIKALSSCTSIITHVKLNGSLNIQIYDNQSVRFCVSRLNEALRRISSVPDGRFSNEAEKLLGRLEAELQFSTIDEIFAQGLHRYLDILQAKLNAMDFSRLTAPAAGLLPEVTNDTSPMMMKIGATKAKNTVTSSCLGVLIGPVWSSSWLMSLMVSSIGSRLAMRCGL